MDKDCIEIKTQMPDAFTQQQKEEIGRYMERGETQEVAEVLTSFRGFINGIGEINRMANYLKRDAILSCEDLKTEEVYVPEWGGTVIVKMMSGAERDAFEASLVNYKGDKKTVTIDNIRAKLVQKTIIDPDTKEPMFTVGDIEALGKKSAAALDRVFSVAQSLSKITGSDVEELAKN